MAKKNNDFLKKLLATFKVEAEEHIRKVSSGLLELERRPSPDKEEEIIETIFREAHSLKGAARAVNMTRIEAILQSMEGVFAAVKRKEIALSSGLLDLLYQGAGNISRLLLSTAAKETGAEGSSIDQLIQRIEAAVKGSEGGGQGMVISEREAPPESRRSPSDPSISETVRISTSKLGSLLLKTEDLLSAKLMISRRGMDLHDVIVLLEAWARERARISPYIREAMHSFKGDGRGNGQRRGDQGLIRLLKFLEAEDAFCKSIEKRVMALADSAEQDHLMISRMVDDLLWDMKKVLMLPCSSLFEVFPRFVRDLSYDQGKETELVIEGGEIEIDRRILEEIKDPLLHLVRNGIDHGIEQPGERERKGKPGRGRITILISHKDGDRVEILVSDDGAGVDLAKVRAAALRVGILSQKEIEGLSDQEALSLIFRSGVSTSPIITDISGRGLGLAIVQEKTEKLGGAISLDTHPDIGTRFRIILPLTLAAFRGLLIREAGELFILPLMNLEQVARIGRGEIKTVENRETISIKGEAISLVRLGDILGLQKKSPQDSSTKEQQSSSSTVTVSTSIRIAFSVDEVLNEEEVLVKGLGKQLSRVRNISGVTLLGAGKVVPILNVPDLVRSAVKMGGSAIKAALPALEEKEGMMSSILVAEDSITARMLLKNILEAAGYDVKTAVDGTDAFTQLRAGEFDLLVSDVDMPGMNGFDLTAKVRADKKLSDLPVLLVTALESREDQERGIDVGADAYIVKSSFDQGNLLEVVQRLIVD